MISKTSASFDANHCIFNQVSSNITRNTLNEFAFKKRISENNTKFSILKYLRHKMQLVNLSLGRNRQITPYLGIMFHKSERLICVFCIAYNLFKAVSLCV